MDNEKLIEKMYMLTQEAFMAGAAWAALDFHEKGCLVLDAPKQMRDEAFELNGNVQNILLEIKGIMNV